ncbi:MAG: ACT domain-containing protein [Gemmatimonadales bacterium]
MARPTAPPSLDLTILPDQLSVCRLGPGSPVPDWAVSGRLTSVAWTAEETSIVCPTAAVPPGVQSEPGWRAFAVAGPLDFGLTGILLSIAKPLADVGVSIFAISTYDTDYVLVRESSLEVASAALTAYGHRLPEK